MHLKLFTLISVFIEKTLRAIGFIIFVLLNRYYYIVDIFVSDFYTLCIVERFGVLDYKIANINSWFLSLTVNL